MERSVNVEQWKTWRNRMEALYFSGSLLLGVLFTGYFATEYNYIGDVIMHENQTEFYYSLNLGASHVSAVMATFVGSIYYDFTMNLKAARVTSLTIVAKPAVLSSLFSFSCHTW